MCNKFIRLTVQSDELNIKYRIYVGIEEKHLEIPIGCVKTRFYSVATGQLDWAPTTTVQPGRQSGSQAHWSGRVYSVLLGSLQLLIMTSSEEYLEPNIVRSVRMEERTRIENRNKLWELVDRRNDALLYNKMGKPGFARYVEKLGQRESFKMLFQDCQRYKMLPSDHHIFIAFRVEIQATLLHLPEG